MANLKIDEQANSIDKLTNENTHLQIELADYKQLIFDVKIQLENQTFQNTSYLNKIDYLEKEISDVQSKLEQTQEINIDLNNKLESNNYNISELNVKIESLSKLYAEQLKSFEKKDKEFEESISYHNLFRMHLQDIDSRQLQKDLKKSTQINKFSSINEFFIPSYPNPNPTYSENTKFDTDSRNDRYNYNNNYNQTIIKITFFERVSQYLKIKEVFNLACLNRSLYMYFYNVEIKHCRIEYSMHYIYFLHLLNTLKQNFEKKIQVLTDSFNKLLDFNSTPEIKSRWTKYIHALNRSSNAESNDNYNYNYNYNYNWDQSQSNSVLSIDKFNSMNNNIDNAELSKLINKYIMSNIKVSSKHYKNINDLYKTLMIDYSLTQNNTNNNTFVNQNNNIDKECNNLTEYLSLLTSKKREDLLRNIIKKNAVQFSRKDEWNTKLENACIASISNNGAIYYELLEFEKLFQFIKIKFEKYKDTVGELNELKLKNEMQIKQLREIVGNLNRKYYELDEENVSYMKEVNTKSRKVEMLTVYAEKGHREAEDNRRLYEQEKREHASNKGVLVKEVKLLRMKLKDREQELDKNKDLLNTCINLVEEMK